MDAPRNPPYRLPAEWEPQEAVWLSWPIHRETWPEHWEGVQTTFAEIALQLSRYQKVYLNLASRFQAGVDTQLDRVSSKQNLPRGEIEFFDHPVNDVWVRDHGPLFLINEDTGSLVITDWKFNGWGGKFPSDLDNKIPSRIAQAFGYACTRHHLVLEGGSIETNGVGDLLVTTDCLLNSNRNPGLSRAEIEERLQTGLQVECVHWLDGCIEGDDTDGHIDNLVRFYSPSGVLVASTDQTGDANYPTLLSLAHQCKELVLKSGESLDVVPLPLPPARFVRGRRLPMSYLNFYIANGVVLMPSFGYPPSDDRAHAILSEVFSDREIVQVDCRELILEGGAVHCLTQQVPQTSA